ncbi:MAG: hypothetical protein ACTSU2_10710 [Promethearchaeota archaeon]
MDMIIFQETGWEQWLKDNYMDPVWGYARGYNLILWAIAILTMYIAGLIFYLRSKKVDVVSAKWFYKSFALFFWIMGITRILFIFAYHLEAYYHAFLAYGYAFGALSLLPIVFILEKWMIHWSHRFFTIVGIVLVILGFYFAIFNFNASELSRTIQEVGMPILFLSFLILYLWLIKISTGSVRKKAVFTLIGIIITVLGIVFDGESFMEALIGPLQWVVLIIPPIIFTLGIIMMIISQKID